MYLIQNGTFTMLIKYYLTKTGYNYIIVTTSLGRPLTKTGQINSIQPNEKYSLENVFVAISH